MARLGVIPSLPGAHEPTFLTRDARVLSLDRLIFDVVEEMTLEGRPVSPYVAKCAVQAARHRLAHEAELDLATLTSEVQQELRRNRVLLTRMHVTEILQIYGSLIASLGIVAAR